MKRQRLQRLRETRQQTLEMVRGLSQDEIDFAPPGGWSVGQILDHLRRADLTYSGEIRRLIELKRSGKRPTITVGLAEMEFRVPWVPRSLLPLADIPLAVFNYFLPESAREFFLRNPVVPAESPAVLKPEAGGTKDDLIDGLRDSLSATELLFLQNLDLEFGELRYYHPLFGYNNAYDILRLMTAHEERHQKQLKRILQKASGRR